AIAGRFVPAQPDRLLDTAVTGSLEPQLAAQRGGRVSVTSSSPATSTASNRTGGIEPTTTRYIPRSSSTPSSPTSPSATGSPPASSTVNGTRSASASASFRPA